MRLALGAVVAILAIGGTAASVVFTEFITVRQHNRADVHTVAEQHAGTYARAVEQLASPTPDARMGGIRALAALANSAPDYRSPVCDLLHSYVVSRNEPAAKGEPHTPGPDIIAALQAVSDQRSCPGMTREFIGLNLRGLSYPGLRARGADLSHADLTAAGLSEADLSGVDLSGAKVGVTNLYMANLSGAVLIRVNLSGSNLFMADLAEADLSGAVLSRADLSAASLFKANLYMADLSGANLYLADLSGVDLSGADLSGANFWGMSARLPRLDGTRYNDFTRWPAGFSPPPSAVRVP
jgi:uncharacterized protein YjbI with pentapeptide repeats